MHSRDLQHGVVVLQLKVNPNQLVVSVGDQVLLEPVGVFVDSEIQMVKKSQAGEEYLRNQNETFLLTQTL